MYRGRLPEYMPRGNFAKFQQPLVMAGAHGNTRLR